MGLVHYQFADTKERHPEVAMAKLVGRYLNIEVDPKVVESIFSLHWKQLSTLAHAIHEKHK